MNKLRRRVFLGSVLSFLPVVGATTRAARPVHAAIIYAVTEIGTLAGEDAGQYDSLVSTWPAAISSDGTVVANASSSDATGCCDSFTKIQGDWSVPFRSTSGRAARLGNDRTYRIATDINSAGDIAGYSTNRDDDLSDGDAVVWRGGEFQRLPSLGGDFGIAYGINDHGQIVGASRLTNGDPQQHATLWVDGEAFDLGTVGGDSSIAYDINNEGAIAGAAIKTAVRYRPVIWQGGSIIELPLPTNWVAGEALAINDAGVAVGGGYLEFSEAPLMWANDAFVQLPGFAERVTGVANDINDDEVIVGRVYRDEGYVAVRWDDSGVVDLNDLIDASSDYRLIDAVSINDSGQILSTAVKDGVQLGVVLMP